MKLFIASIIILFGIVFFLFCLFPSEMSVSRVALFDAPRDSVFGKISDLRTWPAWNALLTDSGMKRNGLSAIRSETNRLESGRLTVLLSRTTADSVISRWVASSGRSFTSDYILTKSGGQVILQWTLHFHLRWYPWEKMAGMFYDRQLGPLMEQSFGNLRKILAPA